MKNRAPKAGNSKEKWRFLWYFAQLFVPLSHNNKLPRLQNKN